VVAEAQTESESEMSKYSYPVELEGEEQEVFVVVSDIEPYRPATRYAPAEGGVYDWHLSRTEYGERDDSIKITRKELELIDRYMEDDLNKYYGE
jgi:hypothetical protein